MAKKKLDSNTVRNPLLAEWPAPFGLPPYDRIRPEHFAPAFEAAMADHLAEIEAIAENKEAPTLANTIDALELAGEQLGRVAGTFFGLCSAHTNPELQKVQRGMAPRLSSHMSAVRLNRKLFSRIADLHARRNTLQLSAEQLRVLDRIHTSFQRNGAGLDTAGRRRLAAIDKKLAALSTKFSQNVLADESAWHLELEGEADLVGLPEFARDAAAQAAQERGLEGKYAVTLARASYESFMMFSPRRDLREVVFNAWTSRGANGGRTDNREVIAETLKLRAERAHLLGFKSHAAYRLDDTMAKTPAAAGNLLREVWSHARKRAEEERADLTELVRAEGRNHRLEPWDWRYYAEKLRRQRYDLEEAEIKPYLQLDKIVAACFHTAERLFGLTFRERTDLPKYHPDLRTWEVHFPDGREQALFIGDYFARPSKNGGAWMSALRSQRNLGTPQRPVVINVANVSKGRAGQPTLLSFDDARTVFHEFGHALHGLMSDVTYPSLAGTAVSTDFVELPSQLYEHWLAQPQVLKAFAIHHKTGKAMPKSLLDRLQAALQFNQGFATVEYTACALLDLEIHAISDPSGIDVDAFEKKALRRLGMPREITMRHRLPHFSHLFSGGHYAAGYYSYMWSEVMDADAFAAFEEAGKIFHKPTAKRLGQYIYSAGNLRDPAEAYMAFRGRLPDVGPLLEKRGFGPAVAEGI